MTWTVRATSSVERFMAKLDFGIAERIAAKMEMLLGGPFPMGYKKLKGGKNAYRLRVGDYRILYEVDSSAREITIYTVEHRGKVYR
jgi:mRNA interferase RelE/StbE